MDRERLKAWLDEMVRLFKESEGVRNFENRARACIHSDDWILVHEGLEEMAEVMGLDVVYEPLGENYRCDYQASFVYEGVKFVSYLRGRLDRADRE